jgi:hypothetical protein
MIANIATVVIPSETISSSMINELHKRALILLAKYGFTPINADPFYREPKLNFPLPIERTFVLDTVDSNPQESGTHNKLGFILLQDASGKIGLNLAPYIGKRLLRLNYLLQDSTQANTSITAHILFNDTNLVGAHLVLDGSAPGIVALNDRSQFKPKNFVYPIFKSDLLDTVSIMGPWDKSDNGCSWINRVNFLSKEEVAYFANILSTGRKVNDDLKCWGKGPGEQYAAVIIFKTGERYFPHFLFRNDTAYLNDYKCYYILDRKFMVIVKEIIKTRGISKCNDTTVTK